jgi:glycosyltransferase involved in cell wall biosynthesis
MRFWLVQTGEEMPCDGTDTRLLRTALLADELSRRGHEVVYWNSTFNHQKKVQRFERTCRVRQNGLYDAVFLYGRPYRHNIGLARVLSQRDNAREFLRHAKGQPLPDVIHCGFPPIELIANACEFAEMAGVPSVVDCRDMWPEVIVERLSPVQRLLAAPLLALWRRSKRSALRSATAITGVSKGFVEWGLAAAGRSAGPLDRAFHLTTDSEPVPNSSLEAARQEWREWFTDLPPNSLIICFAGTFSRRLDLETVLDAADLLSSDERARVRIVLCGNGDLRTEIAERAAMNPALFYGGWCNRAQLAALMELSSIGLLPYPNTPDFLASYPNKVGEYLMAGLPIMTGLVGAVADLLSPHGLRVEYPVGNAVGMVEVIRSTMARDDLPAMREKARAIGRSQFNPEEIYPRFADWLELIAQPRRDAL